MNPRHATTVSKLREQAIDIVTCRIYSNKSLRREAWRFLKQWGAKDDSPAPQPPPPHLPTAA